MTLVELPTNQGQIFAVNPHHVTGVQPYKGPLAGHEGTEHDLSVVWTTGSEGGTNLYVCGWTVNNTLAALNAAKRDDALAFAAGYRAATGIDWDLTGDPTPEMMLDALMEWQGITKATRAAS